MINGSFWLGAVGGSLLSIVALNTDIFAADVGWRLTFALGAVLALVILLVRRHVPESPRWLLIHGRDREAEEIVSSIEKQIEEDKESAAAGRGRTHDPPAPQRLLHGDRPHGVLRLPAPFDPRLLLFIGQAFLYNAITFGFGAILTKFFDVPSGNTGYYFAVIAIGNFCGPLLLGKLFDTVGRRVMISSTYLLSGALLFGTAWLFDQGSLNATTMTACWCAVLFFASAGASSAYLTVSEVFPMETRAMSIAFFYALGTAAAWHQRPPAVRQAHRHGQGRRHGSRLLHRRDPDVPGGPGRGVPRGQGRATLPGGHRQAPDGGGGEGTRGDEGRPLEQGDRLRPAYRVPVSPTAPRPGPPVPVGAAAGHAAGAVRPVVAVQAARSVEPVDARPPLFGAAASALS